MRARAVLAIAATVGLAAACSEISGVARFHIDEPGELICDDGVDGEADELTDCQDPECNTHICADVAPQGWEGPAVFRVVVPGEDPACPNGVTPLLLLGEDPDVAHEACSSCTCGAKPVVTCSLPLLQCGSDCMSLAATFQSAGGACATQAVSGSCRAVSTVDAAVCAAAGAEPGQPAFAAELALCPGGGAGCEAGTCLEQPSATSKVCIHLDSDEPCPPGRYVERHVVYDEALVTDQRSCFPSSCTCDVLDQPTCDGEAFELYDNVCSGSPKALVTSACAGPVDASHVRAVFATSSGGTCTISGSPNPVPVGALVLPAARTLCCID